MRSSNRGQHAHLSGAARTVNLYAILWAEPKHSAPFTHLERNSQIHQFVLQRIQQPRDTSFRSCGVGGVRAQAGCASAVSASFVVANRNLKVERGFLRFLEFHGDFQPRVGLIWRAKVLCLPGASSPTLISRSNAINYRRDQLGRLAIAGYCSVLRLLRISRKRDSFCKRRSNGRIAS